VPSIEHIRHRVHETFGSDFAILLAVVADAAVTAEGDALASLLQSLQIDLSRDAPVALLMGRTALNDGPLPLVFSAAALGLLGGSTAEPCAPPAPRAEPLRLSRASIEATLRMADTVLARLEVAGEYPNPFDGLSLGDIPLDACESAAQTERQAQAAAAMVALARLPSESPPLSPCRTKSSPQPARRVHADAGTSTPSRPSAAKGEAAAPDWDYDKFTRDELVYFLRRAHERYIFEAATLRIGGI
jgi:hypothetical protein